LDELREADVLIHVVDISHPNFEEQMSVVNQTLSDLNVKDKTVITIFNKIDAYLHTEKEEDDLTPRIKENITLEELKESWMAKGDTNTLFISATEKTHLEEFRELLYGIVRSLHAQRYPYDHFLY
jgi:GTPase